MKKSIYNAISISVFVLCLILGMFLPEYKNAVLSNSSGVDLRKTVIIDAGHGGFDGGAEASDGTAEKEINLKISKNIKEILSIYGINVIMTREDDSALDDIDGKLHTKKVSDMQNRLSIIKENPDAVFVSIHLNKFTTSAASGAQVFYSKNNSDSKILASSIRESIINLLEPENTRSLKKGNDNIYLLKNATIPAVIVECGFLSNHRDLELLKTKDFQRKMSFAISCGILNYL